MAVLRRPGLPSLDLFLICASDGNSDEKSDENGIIKYRL